MVLDGLAGSKLGLAKFEAEIASSVSRDHEGGRGKLKGEPGRLSDYLVKPA